MDSVDGDWCLTADEIDEQSEWGLIDKYVAMVMFARARGYEIHPRILEARRRADLSRDLSPQGYLI